MPISRVSSIPNEPPLMKPKLLPLEIDHAGWLRGLDVEIIAAHPSWYYEKLSTPDSEPVGVIWHYTATNFGTARSMAKRRTKARRPDQRASSWHVTVAGDGTLWQLVPMISGAWHCRGKHNGLSINRSMIGIELEGHGKKFPDAQCKAAHRLVQALVDDYGLKREDLEHGHRDFDPKRRDDPGDLWAHEILPGILDDVFED
jgi:N-acetyl-anhydromuramyl-L-alanine amidase AmpD